MEPNDFRDEQPQHAAPGSHEPDENPYLATARSRAKVEITAAKAARSKKPHPHVGWSLLWVLGFWGFQIAVSVAATVLLLLLVVAQGKEFPGEALKSLEASMPLLITAGTFSTVVFAVAVAVVFYRRAFSRRLAIRGMTTMQWTAALLLVLPMAILASEVTNYAAKVLPQMSFDMLADFSSGPLLLVLVAACLFPAVGEEILCRGFIGRGLVANHGVVAGVLVASLLFGVLHIDPVQSLGAFILGLGLHFVYLTTRSLWAPVLIHFLNNTFAFLVFRNAETFPLPGLTPQADGTMTHTPPLVLLFAAAAVVCVCSVLFQARTRWLLPDGSHWDPGYETAEQPPAEVDAQAETCLPSVALLLALPIVYAALLWALLRAHQTALDQM